MQNGAVSLHDNGNCSRIWCSCSARVKVVRVGFRAAQANIRTAKEEEEESQEEDSEEVEESSSWPGSKGQRARQAPAETTQERSPLELVG